MESKFVVTLESLRQECACYSGYNKVVRMLQGNPFTADDQALRRYIAFNHTAGIPLADIARNNGIRDALWATRCLSGCEKDLRLFAVWCARQVEHLMEDQRSKDALDVAERFANGQATEKERAAASIAAWDVARASAPDAASNAASNAASAAAGAALDAVSDPAWYAAWAAAWYAAWAALDAGAVVARSAQLEMFCKMCEGTAPWQQQVEACNVD